MSMRSEVKRCRRCGNVYFSDRGNPFRGCPYCRQRLLGRWERIKNLAKRKSKAGKRAKAGRMARERTG